MSHQHRGSLTGEHPWGDAGQIVLAMLFLSVWFLDSFAFRITTFLNSIVPLYVRIPFGVVNILAAAYLAKRSQQIIFGEDQDKPRVIRNGVFGIVRHPVYLSEILLYLGLILSSLSLGSVVIWILGIGFLHAIARYEERLLLARFGDDYRDYMREVPMWGPWIWRRRRT